MNGARPLASALGAVREGAQAIENLLHLLGSRRVGPKAIGVAIVDVRDGCVALRSAIASLRRELVDLLRADEEASALAASLLDRAEARVESLSERLLAVKKVDVDARARLSVEAVVRGASAEIDAVLSLVDLVARAVTARPSELDARDLLRGDASATLKQAPGEGKMTFMGDAKVVGGALALARSIVASGASGDRAQAPSRVIAAPIAVDRVKVHIYTEPPRPGASSPRRAPSAPAPRVADAQAEAALRAVARLSGFELTIAPSGRAITLIFGQRLKAAERAAGVVEPGV